MAVLLATFSVIMFYSESILLLYQASLHNTDENRAFFFVLLSIFVASQILTNTASALLISIRMDFSGKPSGRLLCAVLHLGQQSVIWRLGKLVMFYDQKDWIEMVLLRMISIGVQTLPYLAIQSYLLLTSSVEMAMSIVSLVISLTSATIGLTTFTIRNHVNAASWIASTSTSINTRKHCGYVLLLMGTFLGLASRLCSIILMTVEKLYLIAIPLGIHVVVLLLTSLLHSRLKHKIVSWKDVMKLIAFTYLNIFDLTDEYFDKIQCKYVSYYTVILVENIIMTAVWLMSSSVDYTIKLIMILSILTCFICSLILKFTAGGLLFRTLAAPDNMDSTLDVKAEKYIDNLVRQQPSNTSSKHHRTSCKNNGNSSNQLSTNTTSLSEFSQSVVDSADILTCTLKPWEHIPLKTLQCKQKQNGYGRMLDGQIGKHKIINTVNCFDDPVTLSSNKSKLNKTNSTDSKHSVIKCYVIPQGEESKHNMANFDMHSSNSRNTNTLAQSNITSSQISNEILTQDSAISKGKRFRFQHYPQVVLSMIKKHKSKLHKKKSKITLFSPGSDNFFSCETVSEYAQKDRTKQTSSCVTEIEEFNWNEDITSSSTSTVECGSSNAIRSRTDSFITELSSTSFSTWPSLHFEYFNPSVLPKQSLNSDESIKHWLDDVHRHTQDIPEGYQVMPEGYQGTPTCYQGNHEGCQVMPEGYHGTPEDYQGTPEGCKMMPKNEDFYKGHQDFDECKDKTGDHQHVIEIHKPEQSLCKISEDGITQHSNENTINNSPSVSEQCILNSTIDDVGECFREESPCTLSGLSETHITNTNSTGDTSSDKHFSSSQECVFGLGVNRTFSSNDTVQNIPNQNEKISSGELSKQTVPFCVKLGDMESLV